LRRDEALRIIAAHRDEIAGFGVASLLVFGSVARDEAGPQSDVNLLVEFAVPVGLFELVDLQMFLESLLGRRVDLLTPGALRARLREQVMRKAIRAA